jgi:CHAT domain-containing protein/tetratricopeptide (TPR) repeat protein
LKRGTALLCRRAGRFDVWIPPLLFFTVLCGLSASVRAGQVPSGTAFARPSATLFSHQRSRFGPTRNRRANYSSDAQTRLLNQAKNRNQFVQSVAGSRNAERDNESRLAAALVTEGNELWRTWTRESLLGAIDKFSAARSHWHGTGQVDKEVETLNIIGDVYLDLAEYGKALQSYTDGLSLIKDSRKQAGSLNRISQVYVYLGDPNQALSYCVSASQLSRETGDSRELARALNNRAEVSYSFGKYQESIDALDQALPVWQASDARDKIRTLLNLGYAHFDLRRLDKARSYYDQALQISRDMGNQRGEAQALTAIGGVFAYSGDKQAALDYQNQAINLFRRIGDRNGEAVALNGLGYVYRSLAEYEKSLDCYLQALQLFQLLGNREAEDFTMTLVGKAYEGLGNNAKALELFELAIKRRSIYSQTRAGALNSIGRVLEQNKEREKALSYYRRALSLYSSINDKMNQAASLNRIGSVYEQLGKQSVSLNYFQRALVLSRSAKDPIEEVSTLFNLAAALRQERDYAGALRYIEDSLKIIESLRMKVISQDSRASYSSSIHGHYELQVDVLMQLSKQEASHDSEGLAFNAVERARARSLLELLQEAQSQIREGVDSQLLEKERLLIKTLNARAAQQTRLAAARNTQETEALANEISQLTTEYDELESQIKAKSPRYAALVRPEPLGLKDIQQQVLDDSSVLLEYMLGESRSYLWVITRTEISSYELPPRAEIENAAWKFRELLTANQPKAGETFEQRQARIDDANNHIAEASNSLSRLVIAPALDKLGMKRLIVVPDGALQYIPFEALLVSGTNHADELPLLVDHEVVYEPSASALALVLKDNRQRMPAPKSIAIFANPVFETDDPRVKSSGQMTPQAVVSNQKEELQGTLRDIGLGEGKIPALPASRDEAEGIMSVVPHGTALEAMGFDASRTTLMNPELARYRIVHFATHGFVDYHHPELSGLVLSLVDLNGNPQDGFLRLHDIYNLRLSADLVVLSACNTGLGKDLKGEGLIGLTRGFMYAGARSVTASLWKVDDEATAELMKLFYEGMFKRGLTPASALREAQISMWKTKRWHAPYYWAAFVVQGEYNQKVNLGLEPISNRNGTAALVFLLTFSGATILLLWHWRRSRMLRHPEETN